jgi:hypothetical protein
VSKANVTLAHEVIDAVARRDLSHLIDLTHPQVEWRSVFAEIGEEGCIEATRGCSDT